ncbi:MAG: sulfite exporter TauE/SafE family protein [Rariglobus sp.]
MNLEPWQLALAFGGALLVGVSKTGIAGLGMLFVVMFANVIPAKQSSGFVLPLLIFGDVVAVWAYRSHAKWAHVWRLLPWTAAGVVLGYFAMGKIDDRQARLLIGTIIVVMVAIQLWRRWRAKPGELAEHGAWFAPTIGVLAGFTTLIANAAGPLMAIYLLAMRLPKMEYVGTGAVFFLLLNCFKVPFMVDLGLITSDSFGFNLMLAPAVFLGAMLGRKILPKINQKLFENLALGLSAVAGIRLLF